MLDIYNIQGFKLFDDFLFPQKVKNLYEKKLTVEKGAFKLLTDFLQKGSCFESLCC